MMFSHVYKLLRYVCQCLYTHAYPCTVNKSMYIHVYPSFVKPLVPLASICILVTSCYIFFTLFYFVLFHVDSFLCIMVHQFAPIHASRKHRSKGRQDSWVANTRPVLVWASGVQVFLCTLHHITSHYCMSTVGLYVPLISF